MSLLKLAGQLAAGVLLAFTLRRAGLLAAAVWPRRPGADRNPKSPRAWPSILIVVPCHNEAASLPRLLAAIEALDYPRERLRVIVVDDGSDDGTGRLAEVWAKERPRCAVLSLPRSVGKAEALNAALAPRPGLPPAAPASTTEDSPNETDEFVVIYDADHRPRPDSLRRLLAALEDPAVAAASGQMWVANGLASPAAYYTHLESLVNQLITMRAKDRLKLAPALLGANAAYRRKALEAVDGFRRGALLEDSDLTLAFAQAGWETRFVPESVSEHNAPVTVAGHVRQHLRWNRGFQEVAGGRLGDLWRSRLSLPLKLELTFFALGYADRLALLGGALATVVDLLRPGTFGFPRWTWLAYFGVPAAEMVSALALGGEPRQSYARLVVVPVFFALDIGVAAWAAVQGALRRPLAWGETERS